MAGSSAVLSLMGTTSIVPAFSIQTTYTAMPSSFSCDSDFVGGAFVDKGVAVTPFNAYGYNVLSKCCTSGQIVGYLDGCWAECISNGTDSFPVNTIDSLEQCVFENSPFFPDPEAIGAYNIWCDGCDSNDFASGHISTIYTETLTDASGTPTATTTVSASTSTSTSSPSLSSPTPTHTNAASSLRPAVRGQNEKTGLAVISILMAGMLAGMAAL